MAKDREQAAPLDGALNGRAQWLSPAAARLLWIVAYYGVLVSAIVLLWRRIPEVRELLESGQLGEAVDIGPFSRPAAVGSVLEARDGIARSAGVFTVLAAAGALLTTLPVAWVYSLTRRKRGFQQSMVHTLILLPVAIAGMVVLIQNSLPLAFSLAGIVAVLRFRNTLEDAKDGVYIFIATAIGMSAGVGALLVGVVTSVVFNISVTALWWIDFARQPTPGIRGGLARLARLPKLAPVVPRVAAQPVRGEWSSDEAFATAAQAWRRQLRRSGDHEALAVQSRADTTLRVHTLDPRESQPAVERVLSQSAKRWELAGVMPNADGGFTLNYRLRIRRDARSELASALRERGTPQIVGVEFE